MKLYDMTITQESGFTFDLHRRNEQSMRSLTAFFESYGDTVTSVEVGFESDRPMFRYTDEGKMVRNV